MVISRLVTLCDGCWTRVEPYWPLFKSVIIRSALAFLVTSVCLYFSAFLFGTMYYYSMPTAYQSYKLDFQYKRSCIQEHRSFLKTGQGNAPLLYSEECFPRAVVDIDDPSNGVINLHQTYQVRLTLQLPESEANLNIGMFMTTMKYGAQVSSRPASMNFRPFALRILSTALFWPFLLFDFMESTQTISVQLFEEIKFNQQSHENCRNNYYSTHGGRGRIVQSQNRHFHDSPEDLEYCNRRVALLQIDYPDIEIYSATLHVTAAFSGLQVLLFQWPILSFLLGTTIFFIPVLASSLVLLYLLIYTKVFPPSPSNDDVRQTGDCPASETTDTVNEGQTQIEDGDVSSQELDDGEIPDSVTEVDLIGSAETEKDEVQDNT